MDASTVKTARSPGLVRGDIDPRIGGEVFAISDAGEDPDALQRMPDERAMVAVASKAACPATGGGGAKGWSKIALAVAPEGDVRAGVNPAWTNVAPKSAQKRYIGDEEL